MLPFKAGNAFTVTIESGRTSSSPAATNIPVQECNGASHRFAEIQRAIADMENGRVIKPVLQMTDDELS